MSRAHLRHADQDPRDRALRLPGRLRRIPSLAQYVIASQTKPRIEVFTRQLDDGGWLLRTHGPGEQVRLSAVGCVIEVDRVYTDVFEAEPAPG